MTGIEKEEKIKEIVIEMLNDSVEFMSSKVARLINSRAIDADSWNPDDKPMIIPKCIVAALLKDEKRAYMAQGTKYEKMVKKEVTKIGYFIQ